MYKFYNFKLFRNCIICLLYHILNISNYEQFFLSISLSITIVSIVSKGTKKNRPSFVIINIDNIHKYYYIKRISFYRNKQRLEIFINQFIKIAKIRFAKKAYL
jgi:hypothetical protein